VHVRHCPACQCDYRPEIVVCADCGAELVDRDDDLPVDPGARVGLADTEAALPEGFAAISSSRNVHDLTPLADCLLEAGIDCRIRDQRIDDHPIGYQLFVHAGSRAEALDLLARQAPETEEAFDPEQGYAQCPACGAPLKPRASACGDCGLPLISATRECPRCEEPVASDAQRCGNCGAELGATD
jgi:hypothetical protein